MEFYAEWAQPLSLQAIGVSLLLPVPDILCSLMEWVMCVCVYAYICVCIYIYVCVCVCVYMYVNMCVCVCVCVWV